MLTLRDVHIQFAHLFDEPDIRPYAYLLSKKITEGHVCISVDEVFKEKATLPFNAVSSPERLAELENVVSVNSQTIRPFILHQRHLYLHRYFNYESLLLKSMDRLLKAQQSFSSLRRSELEKNQSFLSTIQDHTIDDTETLAERKTDWQFVAAISAYLNNFTIITGGPGTGKTRTVAKILTLLVGCQKDLRIALAAPTGKAAMRMGESLKNPDLPLTDDLRNLLSKLEPSTIHRLLGYRHNNIYFTYNRSNPLPYDVVIIDESSMLDVALFAKLLDAIHDDTRIILLGDKNQLASVEAGSLFGDLCKLQDTVNYFSEERHEFINASLSIAEKKMPERTLGFSLGKLANQIVELKKSYRFHAQSAIGHFSRAIIENDIPKLKFFMYEQTDPSVIIDLQKATTLFEEMAIRYIDFIQEPDVKIALKKLNAFRILCAVRQGDDGIYRTNERVEKFLVEKKTTNYDGTAFAPYGDLYQNRPVIVTQNNKDRELYNGDIGIMRYDEKKRMQVWFEDSEQGVRAIVPSQISAMETVFAMTIHKSQGSEFPEVLVLLPDNKENKLLTRELIYTAVTRAKEKVVLMCQEAVLLQACDCQVQRISGISQRIETELSM